jgi:hypothetical protein
MREINYPPFDPKFVVSVIEATGYRNTHYAIAELVDNSVQSGMNSDAGRCDVDVIAIEKEGLISKILILDNASGMEPEKLRRSLILGQGQAVNSEDPNTKGFGKSSKFGAGLKQASISQCNRAEIFTWQNEKTFMSYIDTEELKSGKYTEVPEPIECTIPKEYKDLFSFKIGSSGTLVVWENMKKRITWKTASGLFRNAEFELGRIYRYLIDDKKVKIRLASFTEITKGNYIKNQDFEVRKNDPLFLMKGCVIEDLWKQNTGFDFVDEEIYMVPNSSSKIKVKYSLATKAFREGGLGIVNFAKKNDGVSILRNGRELELRKHEWSTGDSRDRWIGVEIHFDEELDIIMGVDSKKQRADNMVKKDIDDLAAEEGLKTIEFINKITENPTDENILIEISNSIQKKWSTLLEKVKIYKKGTGTRRFDEESAESEGSDALKKRKEKTRTDQEFIDTNEKEKAQYVKQKLLDTGEIEDEQEREEFATEFARKNLRFLFTYTRLPGQFLFDINYDKGIYNIIINENHPAYPNFINLLERADKIKPDDEPSAEKGLKLLLESWARMEDEAPDSLKSDLQNIRYQWGILAREFFKV